MELKDFIKSVILDVADAVKECQDEIANGTIISPMNVKGEDDIIKTEKGDIKVSYIDFEIAITVNEEQEDSGNAKAGIKVLSAFLGGSVSGETSSANKTSNENISRIRFSIPVAFTPTFVKTKEKVRNKGFI